MVRTITQEKAHTVRAYCGLLEFDWLNLKDSLTRAARMNDQQIADGLLCMFVEDGYFTAEQLRQAAEKVSQAEV